MANRQHVRPNRQTPAATTRRPPEPLRPAPRACAPVDPRSPCRPAAARYGAGAAVRCESARPAPAPAQYWMTRAGDLAGFHRPERVVDVVERRSRRLISSSSLSLPSRYSSMQLGHVLLDVATSRTSSP